jgi:hypothetical protein
LSAVFAVAILVGETLLDALATLLVRAIGVHWAVVFAIYLAIAVAATVGLQLGADAYPDSQSCCTHVSLSTSHGSRSDCRTNTLLDPLTATIRLLITDAKMKYMLGFTAAFGLTGAFLNAFVSGQVVPRALHDPHGAYVGILVAWHGIVAALAAVILGNAPHLWFWYCRYRRSFHGQHDTTVPTLGAAAPTMVGMNECILIAGSIAFGMVALPFLFRPNLDEWTWGLLILVYALQGFGRATFEGTLKVLFAEYFTNHLEAAYSNIILQYGLSSAAAYIWSTRFRCELHDVDDAAVRRNPYCVEYRDGSGHNLFTFAAIVVGTSLVAALGFLRASQISTTAAHRPLTNHHESIS